MDALVAHFRMMARYNALANERLYTACLALPEAEYRRDRRGFFRSIHGTLNHILVGDRIWLTRFDGGTAPSTGLDTILYDDRQELAAARRVEDERIERFAEGLTPEQLSGSIAYRNNQGRDLGDPIALLVAHLFNHQTHHRGQVHEHAGPGRRRPALPRPPSGAAAVGRPAFAMQQD